jgi:hypothetical protein
MRVTKADWRVLALGTPANEAPIRNRFIATAVRTCPRWVLARPMYRVRRSRQTRTPCEIVPSMPARRRYSLARARRRSRCRAAWTAWSCASGRTVRLRRGRLRVARGLMHRARLGQTAQSFSENLILITAFVRLSTAGVQLLLAHPSGQTPSRRSQSTVKSAAAKPWRARAWGSTSGSPMPLWPIGTPRVSSWLVSGSG